MTMEDTIRTMLRNVIDPELGLNIVDLGLVYEIKVEENKAWMLVTMTSMGCPMAGKITNDIYDVVAPLGLDDVRVDLTFDPPWAPSMMSQAARQQLGVR